LKLFGTDGKVWLFSGALTKVTETPLHFPKDYWMCEMVDMPSYLQAEAGNQQAHLTNETL